MTHLRTALTSLRVKLSDPRRQTWLYFITVAGLLASLLLSSSAWSTDRSYPLVPIISDFALPGVIQNVLFAITIIAFLLGLLKRTYRRKATTVALACLLLLICSDITRLQPWVLHYGAILLLFTVLLPRTSAHLTQLLDAARIIVAGIYFWSGLQKLNARFFTEVFPWFTQELWQLLGESGVTIVLFLGLLVPIIEAAFALGFFSQRLRTISLFSATAMLILVLLSIGPTGHGWNSSVWPWNLAIFGSALVLFYGWKDTAATFVQRQRQNYLAWVAFFIFWAMPAGNLFGVTDHYLAWSLYSGRVPEATLVGDQATLEHFSPTATDGELGFINWTQTDLNLVPYPEARVFQDVFRQLCKTHPDLQLSIMTPRLFVSTEHTIRHYQCPTP